MRAKLIVLPILLTATSATVAQDVAAPAPPPAQSYLPGFGHWARRATVRRDRPGFFLPMAIMLR